MKKLLPNRQAGFGHVELIIIIVIVLALAGVGYFVFTKNKNNSSSGNNSTELSVQEAIKNAKCDYDEALCKFYEGFSALQATTVTTVSEIEGQTTKMTIIKDGDKSHVKMEGPLVYEVITIGNATYMKGADGTWWKQTRENEDQFSPVPGDSNVTVNIQEPESAEVVDLRYKKLGKEPCGNLTCFKYQEIDPSNPSVVTYYWFDDKDYLLRRLVTEEPNGKTDSTFSYDKVTINEPSPVKELGPNQIFMPGDSEPQTIPGFN